MSVKNVGGHAVSDVMPDSHNTSAAPMQPDFQPAPPHQDAQGVKNSRLKGSDANQSFPPSA